LLDHVIVAGEKTYSMDTHGELEHVPAAYDGAAAADSGGQIMYKRRGTGTKRKE